MHDHTEMWIWDVDSQLPGEDADRYPGPWKLRRNSDFEPVAEGKMWMLAMKSQVHSMFAGHKSKFCVPNLLGCSTSC